MRYIVTNTTMLGISDFKVDKRTRTINDICTLTTLTIKILAGGYYVRPVHFSQTTTNTHNLYFKVDSKSGFLPFS